MALRSIGLPAVWLGILALPFTGWRTAVLIGGAIAAGGLIWRWGERHRIRLRDLWVSDRSRALVGGLSELGQRHRVRISGWIALFLVPVFINNYWLDILTLTGIYVVLTLGLNMVVGLAGLLDLGYIAFYAIGAYSYALLSTRADLSFWAGLPLSGAAAAACGMLLGLVTLRLRGDYLAIVTLGFIQIVHLILNNWDSVTNGPNGILNIGRPSIAGVALDHPAHFYYLILILAVLTYGMVSRLNRSSIGRAWVAIREDELAAAAMGIHTVRYKMLAFILGAACAGIAGAFFAAKFGFVSPESFTFFESVIILCMVVLGGMGSLPGAVVGAAILVILPEMLRDLASYRMLFFGLLLVLMMVFRPLGLMASTRRSVELKAGPGNVPSPAGRD